MRRVGGGFARADCGLALAGCVGGLKCVVEDALTGAGVGFGGVGVVLAAVFGVFGVAVVGVRELGFDDALVCLGVDCLRFCTLGEAVLGVVFFDISF
jgi:hypothetical protein